MFSIPLKAVSYTHLDVYKRQEEFQRQLAIEREKIKVAEAAKSTVQEVPQNTEQPINEEKKDDDDLSKYMPKE